MATNVSGFPVSYVIFANKHVDVTGTDCVQGEVWAEAAEMRYGLRQQKQAKKEHVIHHSTPDGSTLIHEINASVSKRINQQKKLLWSSM
jgi:hypothetical protein